MEQCQFRNSSILMLVLITTFSGCIESNLMTFTDLEGKWVDVNTKTDTLTFGVYGGKEAMILDRGKEMRDGFLLPKYGSGSYDYELSTDTIYLRWVASSNLNYNRYYFNKTGAKITIGKFFETNKGTLLTFKKMN